MFNSGIELEQPDAIPVIASFLLPLCVNQETLLLIMQCVEEGGLALGLGRQNEHLLPFWQALGYVSDSENAPCSSANAPTKNEVKQIIKYISNNIESEGSMQCIEIVTINGVSYLKRDCGCDETEFYELSKAASVGGVPQPLGDAPTNTAITGNLQSVSEANASCYAEKSVNLMLNRALDFVDAVIGAVSLGIDSISTVDEFVESLDLLYEMFSGNNNDIDTIRQFTKSQIFNAFFSTTTVNALEVAWTFTGKVSKRELSKWIDSAPNLVGGVPVKLILQTWLNVSIIPFYNDRLAEIAIECETNSSFLPAAADYIEVFSDASYKLLQFSSSKTFSIVGDKLTIADFSTPIYAIAFRSTNTGGGFGTSATIHAKINGTIISGIVLGEVENEPLLAGFGAATTMVINNSDYAVSVGNFATGSYVSGELTLEMTQNSNTWVSSVSEIFVVIGA